MRTLDQGPIRKTNMNKPALPAAAGLLYLILVVLIGAVRRPAR